MVLLFTTSTWFAGTILRLSLWRRQQNHCQRSSQRLPPLVEPPAGKMLPAPPEVVKGPKAVKPGVKASGAVA